MKPPTQSDLKGSHKKHNLLSNIFQHFKLVKIYIFSMVTFWIYVFVIKCELHFKLIRESPPQEYPLSLDLDLMDKLIKIKLSDGTRLIIILSSSNWTLSFYKKCTIGPRKGEGWKDQGGAWAWLSVNIWQHKLEMPVSQAGPCFWLNFYFRMSKNQSIKTAVQNGKK